jgi:hypothetical protein
LINDKRFIHLVRKGIYVGQYSEVIGVVGVDLCGFFGKRQAVFKFTLHSMGLSQFKISGIILWVFFDGIQIQHDGLWPVAQDFLSCSFNQDGRTFQFVCISKHLTLEELS